MQSGKVQEQEVSSHAADADQKQISTSNTWINHRGSLQLKFYGCN